MNEFWESKDLRDETLSNHEPKDFFKEHKEIYMGQLRGCNSPDGSLYPAHLNPIDSKIAPLIETLNKLPYCCTTSCCSCSPADHNGNFTSPSTMNSIGIPKGYLYLEYLLNNSNVKKLLEILTEIEGFTLQEYGYNEDLSTYFSQEDLLRKKFFNQEVGFLELDFILRKETFDKKDITYFDRKWAELNEAIKTRL